MPGVHGFCDERFRLLEEAFRRNLDSGLDKGASLAVTVDGEYVVDLWGGTRDYQMITPWEADTVVRVYSTSKIALMIMVLMLVDRGLLDLDEPIATYWPEFAQHGKGAITTRQVLIHRTGLPGYGRPVTLDDLGDRDGVRSILANARPWYEPDTMSCYAPLTFSDLLAEVIERTTGVPFNGFFRRELADPLDADFHFGLPNEEADRVSAIWPHDPAPPHDSPIAQAALSELGTVEDWIEPRHLPTVLPAAGGIGNARALARIGCVLAGNGTVDGRRYLGPEIIADARSTQSRTEDEMVGWVRYGLGFGLDTDDYPGPTPDSMHWGGYGGSFLAMDPVAGVSFAFAQNQLLRDGGPRDDPRRIEFWRLVREITGTR